MEIILGLALVALVAYYVYNRKKQNKTSEVVAEAPYKFEPMPGVSEVVPVAATVTPEPVAAPVKKEKAAKKPKVKKTTEEAPKKAAKTKAEVRANGIKRVK